MYGMLLESVQHYVQTTYTEDTWWRVLEAADLQNTVFTTHKRYSDQIMFSLADACSRVIGSFSKDEWMSYFGKCFVEYFTHYGYDQILRVSGRHFRDFLHGVNNLHETMRFSYPKMVSPSFYVEHEHRGGCLLHYHSKRTGFAQYVIGQLQQSALRFYSIDVHVKVLTEEVHAKGCHIVYSLTFDNSAFTNSVNSVSYPGLDKYPHISGTVFFQAFPFAIVFDQSLTVTHAGPTLRNILQPRQLIGQAVTQVFRLRRPLVEFSWTNIMLLQQVVFELETVQPIQFDKPYRKHVVGSELPAAQNHAAPRVARMDSWPDVDQESAADSPGGATRRLLLKGQMRYIKDLNGMTFLCSPLLNSLDDMQELGLFITDLNMYDTSRDMVMAGSQRASTLEYCIESQIEHSHKITENLRNLEEWRKRSDSLLYSMIPEEIAIRLKQGEDPVNTCDVFDSVSILFTYLLGFNEMCAEISPLQLVECINSVFLVFDAVVDRHKVFKVETLGDAVYLVASGVPDRRPDHAENVAYVALEFIKKVKNIHVPGNRELQVRAGIHTGSVVAGVVGKRMPQYCLFGDTVNTASRMQTYGEPGLVHISETSQKCLQFTDFVTTFRGKVNIKGKGEMQTFWLVGHKSDPNIQIKKDHLKSEPKQPATFSKDRCTTEAYDLHHIHKQSEMCMVNMLTMSRSGSAGPSYSQLPEPPQESLSESEETQSTDGADLKFALGGDSSEPSDSDLEVALCTRRLSGVQYINEMFKGLRTDIAATREQMTKTRIPKSSRECRRNSYMATTLQDGDTSDGDPDSEGSGQDWLETRLSKSCPHSSSGTSFLDISPQDSTAPPKTIYATSLVSLSSGSFDQDLPGNKTITASGNHDNDEIILDSGNDPWKLSKLVPTSNQGSVKSEITVERHPKVLCCPFSGGSRKVSISKSRVVEKTSKSETHLAVQTPAERKKVSPLEVKNTTSQSLTDVQTLMSLCKTCKHRAKDEQHSTRASSENNLKQYLNQQPNAGSCSENLSNDKTRVTPTCTCTKVIGSLNLSQ